MSDDDPGLLRRLRDAVGDFAEDISETAERVASHLDRDYHSRRRHDHHQDCDDEHHSPGQHDHGRHHHDHDHDCDHDHHRPHKHRPGRPAGSSRGTLNGSPATPHDITGPFPPQSWPGPAKDQFRSYLFMRTNPADTGTRPVSPFWESPDIFVLPGVLPGDAPDVPPQLGGVALANAPNTLYAHIWNFGLGAAHNVVADFRWCDPALGISDATAHPIGQATLTLGSRSSGRSHAVVKCPAPWTATYLNGGHECLLVRFWDDREPPGQPAWDAAQNRHVAQRNIHVMSATEQASAPPLNLQLGPLFGAPAVVQVERAMPSAMPWLQLRTGVRGQFPAAAPPTGQPLLSPPTGIGAAPSAGATSDHQHVHDDGQQVSFTTTDDPPGPGQAHVYRVTAAQGGQVFGGYTIVILG